MAGGWRLDPAAVVHTVTLGKLFNVLAQPSPFALTPTSLLCCNEIIPLEARGKVSPGVGEA